MFVLIVLITISIFVPPMWIATAAYVVYLFLTKKKRRHQALLNEIVQLAKEGREMSVLKHVYYEAAKSFAVDWGAKLSPYKNDPRDDTLVIYLNILEKDYQVFLQRWDEGGTLLTVKPTT